MRPYFHHIEGFIEPMKSNFYIEILQVAQTEPLLTAVLVLIFSVVGILIIYNLIEEKNTIIFSRVEHEQKSDGKKRSIKKIKEISQVKTKVTDNLKIPAYYEQKQQYPTYPYYSYPYNYNPYWNENSHNNFDQK